MSNPLKSRFILSSTAASAIFLMLIAVVPCASMPHFHLGGFTVGKRTWTDSPLTDDQEKQLERADHDMKAGHYTQAAAICRQVLDSSTDMAKCLAIANFTEPVGLPLNEVRRDCLNKALSLSQNTDDLILVALKARSYEFFEVTRSAITAILQSAHTIPQLYDVARKCQEVALNDVAHLAMEKAYTGVKDDKSVWDYMAQCKLDGQEDIERKVLKDLLDDQQDAVSVCDVLLKAKDYELRDMNRYGLRRAMDDAKSVEDMQAIFEAARQLNENDIANRADFFVRKGRLIQQIKTDRANYQAQLRAWREGVDLDATQQQQAPAVNQEAPRPKGDSGGF